MHSTLMKFSPASFSIAAFQVSSLALCNLTSISASFIYSVWCENSQYKAKKDPRFEKILQWIIMASLTYVWFTPAKGLVRDISANSSKFLHFLQVCEWHITQLGMLM